MTRRFFLLCALVVTLSSWSCKSVPTTPQKVRTGILLHQWHVPAWSQRELHLRGKHIFITSMAHIDALHLDGGVWYRQDVGRTKKNQPTWIQSQLGHLVLRRGSNHVEVYDLSARKALTTIPCPSQSCGNSKLLSVEPVVIQMEHRRHVSDPSGKLVQGHDGLQPKRQVIVDRRWMVLKDRPWAVAWHWGESTKQAGAGALVDGERLVLYDQKRVRVLSLKTGEILRRISLPQSLGHQVVASRAHKLLWSTTSGKSTSHSTIALLDLNTGTTKTIKYSKPVRRVFASSTGWVLASDGLVEGVDAALAVSWSHSTRSYGEANWNRAVCSDDALFAKTAKGVVFGLNAKTGAFKWSVKTATPGPLVIDHKGRVITTTDDGHLGLFMPAP